MKILFKGWTKIPHSYSIVNGFQLIHLYKNFKDNLEIYVEEMPYYKEEWHNRKKDFFNNEYTQILQNLKKWNGEEVDLIYSITYPYDITIDIDIPIEKRTKKCVFYTSEFGGLTPVYFKINDGFILDTNEKMKNFLIENKNLYFTGPSEWSIQGMTQYGLPNTRNKLITHGVDTTIFFKKNDNDKTRNEIRNFYGVKDTDFLLMNIGAMTRNKGIIHILFTLHKLVNIKKLKQFKLLLKGMGDLYETKSFLEHYFNEFSKSGIINKDQITNLLTNHIIFTDKTLSYENINNLFNAADLYISPYLAEGFNLTVLEALASGCNILVPKTGSTKEFVENIRINGGYSFVHYVDSKIDGQDEIKQNSISIDDLVDIIDANETVMKEVWKTQNINQKYERMRNYINENYSWNYVAKELMKYFSEIINN
jgi:glycosyltransferase involved in cell wall biosynthesis